MPPFPATKAEMLDNGYTFAAMKTCPCGEQMELWNTPRGAVTPMNPMPDMDSPALSHWATCMRAEQFRKKTIL